ncbi:MAG TPA: hypothetical protein VKB45_14920 [Gemmatimonadales bacterium]|nr:hypothetical protein [Gemmatimonadales bacterium]
MKRLALVTSIIALAFWACVEEPTSPARCPEFCPGNKLVAVESLFPDAISRDSTFRGYAIPIHVGYLPITAENGIDSRSITQMTFLSTRTTLDSIDTTTGPNVIDSLKLMVRFLRPDSATRNLRLSFYVLPDSIDSTTTQANLASYFAAPPLRVVNVDSLLAQPSRRDSIIGDTVLTNGTTDTNTVLSNGTRHIVTLRLKVDSASAPYHPADSGRARLSLGVVVTADNRPTVFLGSGETGLGLGASWFYRVDSAGKLLRPDSIFYKCPDSSNPCSKAKHPPDSLITNTNFDSFVYTAPALPPDSNLLIGGTPSQRALLRINIPKKVRDSSQVLRAELFLIPTPTAPVVMGDSVLIFVNRVFADLGLKSPIDADTAIQGTSRVYDGNPTDTVRIELTPLFRAFVADTTVPTSVFVRLMALRRTVQTATSGDSTGRGFSLEGATFTTLRFYSSRTAAFRPVIKLTYVPRIKLGAP